MRDLIFRGKAKNNGKWVTSDSILQLPIVGSVELYDEATRDWVDVIPETVGQYSGLTDKHGVNIFEGDVVEVERNIAYVGVSAERIGLFEVVFNDGCFMKQGKQGLFHFIPSDVCTIVGNKYDNGELL